MTTGRVWLDSGAFSAWKAKIDIDLDPYISVAQRYRHSLHAIVNLDVIAHERTPRAFENAAKQSHEKFQAMRDAGLDPIPVFHHGEDFYWLERYIEDGARYIGLSSYQKRACRAAIDWYSRCFRLIESAGHPIKVHGFAATATDLVLRFPWHSVDSSRWAINFGTALIPRRGRDGKPDYGRAPVPVYASDVDNPHNRPLGSLREADEWIDEYLSSLRLSRARLVYDISARQRSFIAYYQGLEKHSGVKIVYVTGAREATLNRLLHDRKIENRLLSYYHLKDKPDQLEEYLATGGLRDTVRRRVKVDWNSRAYLRHRAIGQLEMMESEEE